MRRVRQDSTGTFVVSLSSAPSAGVTVFIAENSGGDPVLPASPTNGFPDENYTSGSTSPPTSTVLHVQVSGGCSSDSLGFSAECAWACGRGAPKTRTDYKNFNVPCSTSRAEGVFIPVNGTYPDGVELSASANTFLSLRPFYTSDPAGPNVQAYLNGGAGPVFNYHRFRAEGDIASAMKTFASPFQSMLPPA